jgi:SAM-dependent methyltransferase
VRPKEEPEIVNTDSFGGGVQGADRVRVYEENQAWPREVTGPLSRYFLSALRAPPRRCLFLGTATGVNDVLPFARTADRQDRILAGDIEPAFVDRLRTRATEEGLRNVEGRRLDVTTDLSSLGEFDLVTLLFVIHRLAAWQPVVERLPGLVAPGGSFFISQFAGPSGIVFLSNENGGRALDPVSRLIRRYFELLPDRFSPALKSTRIEPVLERLGKVLRPMGHQDFAWSQTLTPANMLKRIEKRAYAPYFSTHPGPGVFRQLREEAAAELDRPVALEETLRIYRFEKSPP